MSDPGPGETLARFDASGVCVWTSDPAVVALGSRAVDPFPLLPREVAEAQLEQALTGAQRTGKEIAVALCALDGSLDDASRVERETAAGRVIASQLRHGDVVALWDDGRMLLLLRGVHHLRGAIRVANKVRVAVEDSWIPVTLSLGVTMVVHGESSRSVVARADDALERALADRNSVASSPQI